MCSRFQKDPNDFGMAVSGSLNNWPILVLVRGGASSQEPSDDA